MTKGKILVLLTSIMCLSGSAVAYAQTNTDALQSIQNVIQQKAQAKQSVSNEIQNIQQEISSLNTYVAENQKALDTTQQKMEVTKQLIEQKREEIVTLEDKILARKNVMKERLVALQHDDTLSLIINVFLNAKSLNDFLERASAVTTLFNADNAILTAQQNDLQQIETDKKEIDEQEQILEEEQTSLASQQANLSVNLQKRQVNLANLQNEFSQIDQQMAMAQQEKANIVSQIQAAQQRLQAEQAAAAKASAAAVQPQNQNASAPASAGNGQEIYVTATAYSPQESGAVTALGYNIKSNPNMKLIAVDPSVIPLGKRVWVEGYGEAIAGDTGGAIQGYRIDVLMPTASDCAAWGRRTVKVIVLN